MNILKLSDYLDSLKRLRRAGWVRKGIRDGESVADHSYGVALISLALADHLEVDVGKLLKMALLHDLVESITGDITPHDKIDKRIKEMEAWKKLSNDIRDEDWTKIVSEYTEQKSDEARLVHDADKLEMVLQAKHYKGRGDMKEFFDHVRNRLYFPVSKKLFSDIEATFIKQ